MKKLASLVAVVSCSALFAVACTSEDPPEFPSGDGDGDETGDGDGDDNADPGGGGAGGGGGETVDDNGDPVAKFVTDGLGKAGDFEGYLFTVAGEESTITPDEFTGSSACASGVIGATTEGFGMIGWNIAQELNEDFTGGDVTEIAPMGSGIRVEALNRDPVDRMRVQIQGVDEMVQWCASLEIDGTGEFLWEDFKTECWGGSGTAFDPAVDKVAQIAVQVPGSGSRETPFDFCVIDIQPMD